ncbi:MAG: HAMP domain-containing sensor histidine kinase [Lysobacterales bacterium]|jgi:two-component system sensor histidine kinase CpxA
MPRLFWKIFFALWLSIMAFALVVAWINQTVVQINAAEAPARSFEVSLQRFEARMARDLKQGGERRARKTLQELPRRLQNHIFMTDERGRELIGRDRMLNKLQREKVRTVTRVMEDGRGRKYTLISAGRPPPRSLLAPGPWGVGMRLGVAAVISALVSFILARYLVAPLSQLGRTSRRLATGDLGVRVGAPLDRRRDEFGQLARDMDEMAHRLQASQQANRRLLRDVSHELRSPLARLRVALEIARNKDQALVAEELNRIELESERLENLVDEVLSLLRESTGAGELNITRFDLVELLQDLVETVDYETGEDGEPIGFLADSEIELNADRELLWRVFENLLRNAMVHSGDGVQVRVEAPAGGEVSVSVLDSGPGIPEAHIDRVFEPFYRVDEARSRDSGGHGLGLAIAASAVRRHGGRVTAHNRSEGGLEVRVVLPLRQGEQGQG